MKLDPMFVKQPPGDDGKPVKDKFDKLAWARNVLRREHSDSVMAFIARQFLEEDREPIPEVDKSDAYRRYQTLVRDEFWKDHWLDVDNELTQRFSDTPNPKRTPISSEITDAKPVSDRSFARFLVESAVLDKVGEAAQRLVHAPASSLQIEYFLTAAYWDGLEDRVRSTLHQARSLTKPKPLEPEPEPAREMTPDEVAAMGVALETAPGQSAASSREAEAARLSALFDD